MDSPPPHEQADRLDRLDRLAARASVLAAVVLIVAKAVAWLVTDSVAIFGSLVDSSADLLASCVTFVSVRHALRPVDREHRYGHGKAEALGALGQAAFITGSAAVLAYEAVHRIVVPEPVERGSVGVWTMVAAMLVTLGLVVLQTAVVRRTGSLAIKADSTHYRSDLVMNAAVILGLLVTTATGWRLIDPLLGLAVVPLLLTSAWGIGKLALDMLMDRELPEDDRRRLEALVREAPEVAGLHDLRTRRAGKAIFVDFHLELDPQMRLHDAHAVCDAVERRITARYPEARVGIHAEPAGIDDPRLDALIEAGGLQGSSSTAAHHQSTPCRPSRTT